jgi:hypothetical protein
MIDEIDNCLKTLFIDWADSKLHSSGGLGKFGELKLSVLNTELGTALLKKEELEKANQELVDELEFLKVRLKEMLPDNRRAKELSDRNTVLKQSLQDTVGKLSDLEIQQRGLIELKNKLEVLYDCHHTGHLSPSLICLSPLPASLPLPLCRINH